MSGKLRIIVLVLVGVVGFAGSFLISPWLGAGGEQAAQPPGAAVDTTEELDVFGKMAVPGSAQSVTVSMKEEELSQLIREVRLKIDACKQKQDQLEQREERIRIAGETLKKQAEQLEALRVQLVAPLTRIQEEKAALEATRIRIGTQERTNIKRLAKVYEKMDAATGGEILIGMCKNKQEDDAVKILRYMSERSAGKVLSEMTDKELAARLCTKLQRLQEEEG
jgi:flagellar motility protein MotE (MotC chaperone)